MAKVLSENQREKRGLFNGNINRPKVFVFVWAVTSALLVGTWVFFANALPDKRDYTQAELDFGGAYRKKDLIVLTLSGSKYTAREIACDVNGVLSLKNGDRLSVITAKTSVISMEYNGRTLVFQERAEEYYNGQRRTCSVVFGIVTAFWAVYSVAEVWVIRNARRLPRMLVLAFVSPKFLDLPPRQ